MKNEMILVIQEYMQQHTLFMGSIHYALNLLQEYLNMAKAAAEAAGMNVDFGRLEQQVQASMEMRETMPKEEELNNLLNLLQDIMEHQYSDAKMQEVKAQIHEEVSKFHVKDADLLKLLRSAQEFDETLRFDEVYVDIMEYVRRMPQKYNDYQMASGMLQAELLRLCEELPQ